MFGKWKWRAPPFTSPSGGEVGAQRRVRGPSENRPCYPADAISMPKPLQTNWVV
jgi:hypothetical protein